MGAFRKARFWLVTALLLALSLPANIVEAEATMVAETSMSQGMSQGFKLDPPYYFFFIVVMANINRIKNPTDNSTAIIPGGIGSYSATVSASPSNAVQFLKVNGVAPFNNPTFDKVTGVFSVANVTVPIQPNNTTVAEVVPVLTGNTTTRVTLTVAFQTIGAAGQPGLNMPEEHANTITLLRADADNNGIVNVVDALLISQYLVGQRTLGEINALNAASIAHDGAGGDEITISDALAIEQFLVGQLNAYLR